MISPTGGVQPMKLRKMRNPLAAILPRSQHPGKGRHHQAKPGSPPRPTSVGSALLPANSPTADPVNEGQSPCQLPLARRHCTVQLVHDSSALARPADAVRRANAHSAAFLLCTCSISMMRDHLQMPQRTITFSAAFVFLKLRWNGSAGNWTNSQHHRDRLAVFFRMNC